ncbi:hypothetical protein ACFO0C_49005, partial [Actinoplanes subglobosus]
MRRTSRWALALTLTVAMVAPAAPAAADPDVPVSVAAAYATVSCGGVKAMDTALATRLDPKLNGTLRGYLSGYRMSCARRIVEAVRARGLAKRAAAIAVTTAIVESTLQNISEEVDHDSLGLFQQRASWGTAAQRLNPQWATDAFLNRMISLYPNNSWNNTANPIGVICQAVQVSAYPDRYQVQASDGSTIAYNIWDALSNPPVKPVDTVGMFDPDENPSFHLLAQNAAVHSKWAFELGAAGDLPVTGDWDGNGKDSVGIFRPSGASFHLTNSLANTGQSDYIFTNGLG